MKAVLKVYNINDRKDVSNIQKVVGSIEGILACEISKEKKEIQIIYNEAFVDVDKITENLENSGYMVY